MKGVLDWRVSNSGIDESFRSPLYLHTLRTAPAQRAAVLAGLGRSLVQFKPLQSIVLSCERVPGTLQPSEFLGEFVQADGWVRLPVTPLNPGSGKLRRIFLMSRNPHGSSRFESRIPPEKSRRLVIPRTSCWRCLRTLVRAAARPSARQLCRSRRSGRCQHPRFPCLPSPSSARVQKPDRRRWRLV
jgi:hypothetical protein